MKTRIKNLREDHDLTQKQLSEYLKISQVAYSYYELNRRSIPVEVLSKLADYYNTSIDYLLYKTNVSTRYPKRKKMRFIDNDTIDDSEMGNETAKASKNSENSSKSSTETDA